MPVVGSYNQAKVVKGPGQVYLVAYPSGGYTGGTDALKVTNVKSQFFTDSATDADRVLIPTAYSEIDANGINPKLKQAKIEFGSQYGKYKVANGPSEFTCTWSYKDIDANKIIDAFSAVAGDTFTTTAAAGVAGRKSVLLGRQSVPLFCAALIHYPSQTTSAGSVVEWQNIYVPYCTITPEWDIKIASNGVATVKMELVAIPDMSLQGTQAYPPIAIWDDVTSAGL